MTETERQQHMSYLYGCIRELHKDLNLSSVHYAAMAMTESAAHDFFIGKPYSIKAIHKVLRGKEATA